MTVKDAGALWLESAKADGLERVTVESYRQQLHRHIAPFIGSVRLWRLNAPAIRTFEDQLREAGRSPSMVRRVRKTLGTFIADAQERGHTSSNPVHELRARRTKRKKGTRRERGGKLKVGVDIPTPAEVRRILDHANDRWRPFLMTAALTGLRVSELRGLRWADIDLTRRVLRVHQRADRYNEIGPPKSEAGEREIPLPAMLVAELKAWRKVCPTGERGLAFPTGAGHSLRPSRGRRVDRQG
jgi:integrase